MKPRKIGKISSGHGGPRKGSGGKRPGAGRPRTVPDEIRDAIEDARAEGRSALPEIMRVQIAYAKAGSTKAAEWVANRCGMPEQKELKIDMPDSDKAAAWLEAIERG